MARQRDVTPGVSQPQPSVLGVGALPWNLGCLLDNDH